PLNQSPASYLHSRENVFAGSSTIRKRPASEGWLLNPSWIDGGVEPPQFYYEHSEMDQTLREHGIDPSSRSLPTASAMYDQLSSRITPTPPAPIPSLLTSELTTFQPSNSGDLPDASRDGHLVNICLVFALPVAAAPTNSRRGASTAAAKKKGQTIKMDNIVLEGICRVDFIKAFLSTHGLADKFSPGIHSGPPFKLWWKGSSGGKSGAPSIQTDGDFDIALAALLQKSNKGKVQVSVEIDLDHMDGYRITPTVSIHEASTDEELVYGTRVPKVQDFSEDVQLHGQFIVEIKKRWPCQTHQSEHGQAGHCYIPPHGEHVRLNPYRFKLWAAAIAAGDATKHEPPNIPAFDGARDGRMNGPKSRGRTGPRGQGSSLATSPDAHSPDQTVHIAQQLMGFLTALVPLITTKDTRKRTLSGTSSSPVKYSTPKRQNTSSAPIPDSPIPERGSEVNDCLLSFQKHDGHDLLSYASALVLEDYTPDIIPFIADTDLAAILDGVSKGTIVKFKLFCKSWHNRQAAKLI
ncbi:hypothetical protein HYPSUDRAFT_118568, partial [Hypholoma sublateritium FD-334 SS-4]